MEITPKKLMMRTDLSLIFPIETLRGILNNLSNPRSGNFFGSGVDNEKSEVVQSGVATLKSGVGKSGVATLKSGVDRYIIIIIIIVILITKFIVQSRVVIFKHYCIITVHLKYNIWMSYKILNRTNILIRY